MTIATIPLARAARTIPTDPSSLRRALNRFGIVERGDDGQRMVDERIVKLFQRTKRSSGYLYPRTIDTRAKLMSAAVRHAGGSDG
jgi:hypothetical protein